MNPTLVLGTRGSDLALAQSKLVHESLKAAHPGLAVELKIIATTGDAHAAMPLHEPTAEGAGLCTKQLEEALLSGEIDLAVHSLKDLPVETRPGLTLAAILPRAPVTDLLVSRHPGGIAGLPEGAVIGTSSPRRNLLLKARRPDLRMVPIRGNVPTRLGKVATRRGDTPYEATILAEAGLARLGHATASGSISVGDVSLSLDPLIWMLPAPGQGAIAVETRSCDRAAELLSTLHHETTARCVTAERLVLKHLGGGCHLALGALATESGGIISLGGVYVADQLAEPIVLRTANASASSPEEAARLVADQLLLS